MLNNEFHPNWASAPGDTVLDILRERNISINDFANKIEFSYENVIDLLQGRVAITLATARQLQNVLGASVEFWISRDYQYRQDIARFNIGEEQWVSEFPIEDMIKYGWIPRVSNLSDKIYACLRFFDVPNVSVWNERYAGVMQTAAFKKTQAFESRLASVAAWMRQGELEAKEIESNPWDANKFETTLNKIKYLIREKDPNKFIPELRKYCAECGVALVILRTPRGCPISGATKFISPDKALILLSFRFLTDDHFWFSFFHEAGHLVLHGNKRFFLETIDISSQEEQEEEANEYAEIHLIPGQYKLELLCLRLDPRDISLFARKVNVSRGVVIGQLQHLGVIPQNHFNHLKIHYKWND